METLTVKDTTAHGSAAENSSIADAVSQAQSMLPSAVIYSCDCLTAATLLQLLTPSVLFTGTKSTWWHSQVRMPVEWRYW